MQSTTASIEGVVIGDGLRDRQPAIGALSLDHKIYQFPLLEDKTISHSVLERTHTIENDDINDYTGTQLSCDVFDANHPSTKKAKKSTTFHDTFHNTGNCASPTVMSSKLSSNFAELKRLASLKETNNSKRSRGDDADDVVQKRFQNLAEETAIIAEDEVQRMQNAVNELEVMLADDSLGQVNIISPIVQTSDSIEDARNIDETDTSLLY
jgi:hypothetical protein